MQHIKLRNGKKLLKITSEDIDSDDNQQSTPASGNPNEITVIPNSSEEDSSEANKSSIIQINKIKQLFCLYYIYFYFYKNTTRFID